MQRYWDKEVAPTLSTSPSRSKNNGEALKAPPPVLRPPPEAGRRIPIEQREARADVRRRTGGELDETELRRLLAEREAREARVKAAMHSEGRIIAEKARVQLEERKRRWAGDESSIGSFTQFHSPPPSVATTAASATSESQVASVADAPPTPPKTPTSPMASQPPPPAHQQPAMNSSSGGGSGNGYRYVDEGSGGHTIIDLSKKRMRGQHLDRTRFGIGGGCFFQVRTVERSITSTMVQAAAVQGRGPPSSRYPVGYVGREYKSPEGLTKEFGLNIPINSFDLLVEALNACRGIYNGPAPPRQQKNNCGVSAAAAAMAAAETEGLNASFFDDFD